ncbi:hypothetical protein [Bradyrhizobium sp. B120]|uniref:hypothetical protein n=1 Tax=Bradyrhizobium sp. B120 TaxID=3410088 RepID=UPI003B983041
MPVCCPGGRTIGFAALYPLAALDEAVEDGVIAPAQQGPLTSITVATSQISCCQLTVALPNLRSRDLSKSQSWLFGLEQNGITRNVPDGKIQVGRSPLKDDHRNPRTDARPAPKKRVNRQQRAFKSLVHVFRLLASNLSGSRQVSMSRTHAHATKDSQICIVHEARHLLLFRALSPDFGGDDVVTFHVRRRFAFERSKDLGSFWGSDI